MSRDKFVPGQGDSSVFDNEALSFVTEDDPVPDWRFSPWCAAIELLHCGKPDCMADLFERGTPIPIEFGRIIGLALRGGKTGEHCLPFRLDLVRNGKPGSARAGRWPQLNHYRDIGIAAQVYRRIHEDKLTYERSIELVTTQLGNRLGVDKKTVEKIYTKYKNEAPDWLKYQKSLQKIFAEADKLRRLLMPDTQTSDVQ